jgi:hypothetical protein
MTKRGDPAAAPRIRAGVMGPLAIVAGLGWIAAVAGAQPGRPALAAAGRPSSRVPGRDSGATPR